MTYEVVATVLGSDKESQVVAFGFPTRGAAVMFAQDQNRAYNVQGVDGEVCWYARATV